MKPMEEILIVDGYNMIGAWPALQKLKETNLEEARYELLSRLADYQAYSGKKVVVVFDAHQVPGTGSKMSEFQLDVYFTKENETADEYIERLVAELSSRRRQIYVATSDYAEQKMVFGKGALRISARELLIDIESVERQITEKVRKTNTQGPKQKIEINDEIKKIFEKWRRE